MDIKKSLEQRVNWVRQILNESGAKGIIYGNSGGKDCTLVGAICKLATENVLGVVMPCQAKLNYTTDKTDAQLAAKCFKIEQIEVDLSAVKETFLNALDTNTVKNNAGEHAILGAYANINPRLRMLTLYTLAQSKGYLVAGTGNLDEITMGYFTKWGDGAYDFNPIADLTVAEVYDFLRYLNAPISIINKVPTAGLYEGQTDEKEMGVLYKDIDAYLRGEEIDKNALDKILQAKKKNAHKQGLPHRFNG